MTEMDFEQAFEDGASAMLQLVRGVIAEWADDEGLSLEATARLNKDIDEVIALCKAMEREHIN